MINSEFLPEASPFKCIYVDITHRCQMACANCYLPNRTYPDMDEKKLLDLLAKLPRKTDVRLVGGEPTLREDLVELVRKISAMGHRPMLITNGLKLADKNYVQALHDAGLEYAQISLNGYNDDKIYQVIDKMNCAEAKMKAVYNCNEVGLGISISMILIRNLNDHLVSEMLNFAKTLKTPIRVNFRNVGDLGRNMLKNIDNLSADEIVTKICSTIGVERDEFKKYHVSNHQIRYPWKLGTKRSEIVWIKTTDWQNYPIGDFTNEDIETRGIKGRVTEQFTLSPFFEHVKANEFGY